MHIERNDDPRIKQRKCRKRLRREFAQCIEPTLGPANLFSLKQYSKSSIAPNTVLILLSTQEFNQCILNDQTTATGQIHFTQVCFCRPLQMHRLRHLRIRLRLRKMRTLDPTRLKNTSHPHNTITQRRSNLQILRRRPMHQSLPRRRARAI
jgi:hypothetical protein